MQIEIKKNTIDCGEGCSETIWKFELTGLSFNLPSRMVARSSVEVTKEMGIKLTVSSCYQEEVEKYGRQLASLNFEVTY